MTDLGVIFATLLGPIFAVLITRWNDQRKQQYDEKLHIFKTLMSGRASSQTHAFVDAINVIEVVFCKTPKIIDLRNEFVRHRHVNQLDELWLKKDKENYNRLLKAIANELKINAENIGEETTIFLPNWLEKWNQSQMNQADIVETLKKQSQQPQTSSNILPVHSEITPHSPSSTSDV